jgi:hypothetical protein
MKYNGPPGLWPLGIESGDLFFGNGRGFYFPSKTYAECKKMVNTEDMGIASLVNILGRKYM